MDMNTLKKELETDLEEYQNAMLDIRNKIADLSRKEKINLNDWMSVVNLIDHYLGSSGK